MLFFIRGYICSAYRYYGSITNKAKIFDSNYSMLFKLNTQLSSICKSFSSKINLSVTDGNIKKYLNHLISAYQNDNERKNEFISEILKLQMIPVLLDKKIEILENVKTLTDLDNENEEMKELIKEEKLTYEQELLKIDQKILDVIVQNLGVESYENVVMEVVPGVGGQEAMLFAKELLNMYVSYLNYLGFSYEIIELLQNDINGIRKAAILISDNKAFDKLKYEAGVHRVQRIPATERSGRLHTSTAVVTIFPEPKDVDVILLEKDLKIESKKASGAGGQHVNTTNSAIRITHIPTGKSVTCQSDRSQMQNKKVALMKLRSMLYQEKLDEEVSFSVEMRKKQMGSKLRNEKIRTYNYIHDRVTDHRISDGTMHNLKGFVKDGVGLEELQNRLCKHMKQQILLDIIERTESQLK